MKTFIKITLTSANDIMRFKNVMLQCTNSVLWSHKTFKFHVLELNLVSDLEILLEYLKDELGEVVLEPFENFDTTEFVVWARYVGLTYEEQCQHLGWTNHATLC